MCAAPLLRVVALLCALLCAIRAVHAVSVLGSWTDSYSFPTVVSLFNLDSAGSIAVQPLSSSVASDSSSVAALLSSSVDFALTASPLTASQAASHPGLTILPAMSEAVAVVYRLDGVVLPAGASLTLSRATLALIYAGNITQWSDERLQADNPSLTLPNASIVVAYQQDSSATSLTFTSAIHSFLSATAQYLSPSAQPAWPLTRYAASVAGTGMTGVAAAVGNTNHAIGFCLHSVALSYGNAVASLVNRQAHIVQPAAGLVSLTLYESQIPTSTPLTAFTQLVDCWSQFCYPIVMTTYLLLDNTAEPRGCDARSATLDFWTWYYSSASTYSDIYTEWQTVALPSLLVSELSVLTTLESAITCNGTQPTSTSSTDADSFTVYLTVYGPSRIEQSVNALADFYASGLDIALKFDYEVATSAGAMNWTQQTGGPSFFYLDEIPATMSVDPSQFLMLPSFMTSMSLIYNQQLSPTVTLNSSIQLIIDFTVLLRIVAGNISSFYDPAILAINPALATVLDGEPAPITWTFGCLLSPAGSPLFEAIEVAVAELYYAQPDLAEYFALLIAPVYAEAVVNCTDIPGVRWQYAQSEQLIPALVDNVIGSIGYAMDTSTSLAGKMLLSYPYIDESGARQNAIRAPTPEALLACARASFDPNALTIDVSQAAFQDPTCYPLSQVVYACLPRAYAASEAVGGLGVVESLQWIYDTSALDDWANSSMFVRTAQLTPVHASLIAALESVTGDVGTLLKPPVTWQLSTSIRIAGITLAAIGLLLTVVAAVVVVLLRQHVVFRSAAPLLVLVSFAGLLHVFSAIIFLVLPPTSFTCSAFNWCIQFGFNLLVSPIVFKAWRIWRIFGRRKLHVVKLSNRKLLAAIATISACDLIYLAAWYATSPPAVVSTSQSSSTGGTLNLYQETDYTSCSYGVGQSRSFFAAECVIKGAALVGGVLLAFSTRQVTGRFNESKSVALVIYNIVFAIGVIIPILILIDAVGDVQTILLFFCLAEIGFATLAVLFVPKLMLYYATEAEAISDATLASDSYSFIPLDTISTVTQLNAYITALQRHMDEARKALHRHKVNTLGVTPTLVTPTTASGSTNGTRPHSAARSSVSGGPAAGMGVLDTAARSSSPSFRGSSSRVLPQPATDSAHKWRLVENNKLVPLKSPGRSSRSGTAASTLQQTGYPSEPEQATDASDGLVTAGLQPHPQQPHDADRSSATAASATRAVPAWMTAEAVEESSLEA